ncbi:hypothetical protein DFH06DRAFT_1122654 [Mycena polygramma]|nr:hypothetical protein DFH06DRAFT_1122654 [Mycena polygramma]
MWSTNWLEREQMRDRRSSIGEHLAVNQAKSGISVGWGSGGTSQRKETKVGTDIDRLALCTDSRTAQSTWEIDRSGPCPGNSELVSWTLRTLNKRGERRKARMAGLLMDRTPRCVRLGSSRQDTHIHKEDEETCFSLARLISSRTTLGKGSEGGPKSVRYTGYSQVDEGRNGSKRRPGRRNTIDEEPEQCREVALKKHCRQWREISNDEWREQSGRQELSSDLRINIVSGLWRGGTGARGGGSIDLMEVRAMLKDRCSGSCRRQSCVKTSPSNSGGSSGSAHDSAATTGENFRRAAVVKLNHEQPNEMVDISLQGGRTEPVVYGTSYRIPGSKPISDKVIVEVETMTLGKWKSSTKLWAMGCKHGNGKISEAIAQVGDNVVEHVRGEGVAVAEIEPRRWSIGRSRSARTSVSRVQRLRMAVVIYGRIPRHSSQKSKISSSSAAINSSVRSAGVCSEATKRIVPGTMEPTLRCVSRRRRGGERVGVAGTTHPAYRRYKDRGEGWKETHHAIPSSLEPRHFGVKHGREFGTMYTERKAGAAIFATRDMNLCVMNASGVTRAKCAQRRKAGTRGRISLSRNHPTLEYIEKLIWREMAARPASLQSLGDADDGGILGDVHGRPHMRIGQGDRPPQCTYVADGVAIAVQVGRVGGERTHRIGGIAEDFCGGLGRKVVERHSCNNIRKEWHNTQQLNAP